MDRVATKTVLDNVRESLQITGRSLAVELKALADERGDLSLAASLDAVGVELHELWKPSVGG